MRLGSVKALNLMAAELNAKVYSAPVPPPCSSCWAKCRNGASWSATRWTVTNFTTNKNGYTISDAFGVLRSGGTMSATLPQDVRDLHIAVKNEAMLRIEIDGQERGTITGVKDGG